MVSAKPNRQTPAPPARVSLREANVTTCPSDRRTPKTTEARPLLPTPDVVPRAHWTPKEKKITPNRPTSPRTHAAPGQLARSARLLVRTSTTIAAGKPSTRKEPRTIQMTPATRTVTG